MNPKFAQPLAAGVALALIWGVSPPLLAQVISPEQVPLSDANCQPGSIPIDYQCTTKGIRTVAPAVVTVTPSPFPPLNQITATQLVKFSGDLVVGGLNGVVPPYLGPFLIDPSSIFSNTAATVNVTSQYTGTYTGLLTFPGYSTDYYSNLLSQATIGNFNSYQFDSNVVNSIDVHARDSAVDSATGATYLYSLNSVNPTAVSATNSVTLSGRFQNDPSTRGAIVFGTLAGTATLLTANGGTVRTLAAAPVDANGNPVAAFLSPYALRYDVAATVLTKLDETGLVTPTVSVTNGINLNGSTISNVANGLAPGDAVNRGQLNSEANARIAADAQLTTSLTTETSQRLAADGAMATRLSALEGSFANIDSRLNRLDRRASSGTAIATAMSGNAFLPDMKFNLTANVATYGGAHAAALQMGALVSRHVAVNAGVAVGFNRGGQTAARAGMTFGW